MFHSIYLRNSYHQFVHRTQRKETKW